MSTDRVTNPQDIDAPTTFNQLPRQFVAHAKKNSMAISVANIEKIILRNEEPFNIADFTGGQPGQTIKVLGDGFSTFLNNSNIYVNTGADKLAEANVVYTFTYLGGVWFEDEAGVAGTGGGGGSTAWSAITGKPTTIAGYGITDAYTKAQVDALVAGSGTVAWTDITGKPTTLAGYGLDTEVNTLLAGKANVGDSWTKAEADGRFRQLSASVPWADISGKPTTVAGYAISDAYTKSEVYTKAETDAAIAAGGGGGGTTYFGEFIVDKPPAVANAMDDEFTDLVGQSGPTNGLAAKWAWQNQSTSTATFTSNLLLVKIPNSSTNALRLITQPVPAGTWKFRMKVRARKLAGAMSSFYYAGFALRNSANGKITSYAIGIETGHLNINNWSSFTAFVNNVGRVTDTSLIRLWVYLEVEYDGTNLLYRFSTTGIPEDFELIATRAPGTDLGAVPTDIGLLVNEASNTGAHGFFKWFRRIS